ncbi:MULTISPECIES: hypothetical protein [unclassified Streptomyces]|uniref:hypothetical protein n=1 Tax=unclassified Streptomyces TaxID=2593676 RepID=UPI0022B6C4A6|nr:MULTISPECIES: hypothetical protein [unclassified Streptomyces]MCZ7415144.1 hypothetical protein [Streptomyces sp. WMMC897]MCZ7432087.1 hypothetical protein [Streptomyces sp. WMMC1477]
MESAPTAFVGGVCALFGAALLLWTVARAGRRRPVAVPSGPVSPAGAALIAAASGLLLAGTGCWLLLSL